MSTFTKAPNPTMLLLLAFCIVFCLYVSLALLYVLAPANKPTPIPPWPLLPFTTPEALPPIVHCQVDADCESNHLCLGSVCVRKLLRGGQCDPATGQWLSHVINHATFAVCTCLDPTLYTQKFFGGDCHVNVACGVHGTYNPITRACDCEPGYKPIGLACVKRPCTFDALTGRPLKRARYVKQWGCVCDPRYGLFGVQLEGHDLAYLSSPGYDACASIYVDEPALPMPVQVVTYFYLKNREPISMILFHDVKRADLMPLFQDTRDPFLLSQPLWRYDYAQAHFRQHPRIRARTRKVEGMSLFQTIRRISEHVYVDNYQPPACDWVDRLRASLTVVNEPMAYKLLHEYPVCKVLINDPHAHPMFWNKVVVNPLHLTLEEKDHVPHYNAFALKYEGVRLDRWTLELDYDYDIDRYRAFTTNAPDYAKPAPVFP